MKTYMDVDTGDSENCFSYEPSWDMLLLIDDLTRQRKEFNTASFDTMIKPYSDTLNAFPNIRMLGDPYVIPKVRHKLLGGIGSDVLVVIPAAQKDLWEKGELPDMPEEAYVLKLFRTKTARGMDVDQALIDAELKNFTSICDVETKIKPIMQTASYHPWGDPRRDRESIVKKLTSIGGTELAHHKEFLIMPFVHGVSAYELVMTLINREDLSSSSKSEAVLYVYARYLDALVTLFPDAMTGDPQEAALIFNPGGVARYVDFGPGMTESQAKRDPAEKIMLTLAINLARCTKANFQVSTESIKLFEDLENAYANLNHWVSEGVLNSKKVNQDGKEIWVKESSDPHEETKRDSMLKVLDTINMPRQIKDMLRYCLSWVNTNNGSSELLQIQKEILKSLSNWDKQI